MSRSSYVLDGGALLHRVFWHGSTFGDVAKQYCTYVKSKYGVCKVVFDGYEKETKKDHEHFRRTQRSQACPNVLLNENTEVHHTREECLTNEHNKGQLISLLSIQLRYDGHTVVQSESDADTQIVDAALDIACDKNSVTVVADDTDIFGILKWDKYSCAVNPRNKRI